MSRAKIKMILAEDCSKLVDVIAEVFHGVRGGTREESRERGRERVLGDGTGLSRYTGQVKGQRRRDAIWSVPYMDARLGIATYT